MKRLLALLLAALLLTGCSTDKKDAAKPAPAATAAPTSTPMPPPTGLVRQEPQEYQAISASPDGQVELCAKDGALYIRHGESVIPVTINESRGVPDTYGNLAKIHSFGAEAAEQVYWSPDGRYITLWSYRLAFRNPLGGNIFDPHVIDTETGEMYLLDAYETLVVYGHDFATMIDAVYSPDGKYLYVLMYGSLGGNRSQVVRYDLATYEAVMLAGFSENMIINNSLTLLENGSLLLIQDSDYTTPRQEKSTSLIRLTPKAGGWTTEHFSRTDVADAQYCRLSSIAYSQNSRQGLIVTHSQPMREMEDSMPRAQMTNALRYYHPHWPTQQVETDCIVPFQSGNLNSALTTGWWIPSLDAPAALPIPLSQLGDDITADMTGPLPVALYEKYEKGDHYYVSSAQIIQAVLSPDGHYALLACRTDAANGRFDGDAALLLLRLSDMTLTRLPGLTGEDVMAAEYLDWCGNTVYLRTYDETVTYKLQY